MIVFVLFLPEYKYKYICVCVSQKSIKILDLVFTFNSAMKKKNAINKRYRKNVKVEMVQNRIAALFELHIYELFRKVVKQLLGTSNLNLNDFQKKRGNVEFVIESFTEVHQWNQG